MRILNTECIPPQTTAETLKDLGPLSCLYTGFVSVGDPTDDDEVTERLLIRHGPLKDASPRRATNDFIVVVPQVPCSQTEGKRSFPDNWKDYADTVKKIVEAVREKYNGDSRRFYLTGFSLGGNGVFDIASAQSDFWAALWPVDPTRIPKNRPTRPVWMFSRKPNELNFQEVKIEDQNIPNGDYLYTHSDETHVGTATLAYFCNSNTYYWLLKK